MEKPKAFFEQVYAIVRQIPEGKVTSYGRIAAMLDAPRGARAVGYAMRALKHKRDNLNYEDIPWHRVINAKGQISLQGFGKQIQKDLLEEEGIHLTSDYKIDMDIYLWEGILPHEVQKIINK